METEPKPSSSEASVCWRKELDTNLKRLQSLLFGADIAIQKRDYSYAQLLSLRLIGFLDSRSINDVDEAFIRPIRREALSKLDSATQSLIPESDRQAFEQAGRDPGFVFQKQGDIKIEKIKQSKYFKALLQQAKGNTLNEDDEPEKLEDISAKTSKVLLHGKSTTLNGSISRANNNMHNNSVNSRGNGSEDCILVQGHGSFTCINVDEERTHGSSLRSKRAHMEISSPRNETVLSPSSKSEANAGISGNSFVTARTKLEMDVRQKRGLDGSPNSSVSPQSDGTNRGYGVRSYGSRRGIRGFVPPIRSNSGNNGNVTSRAAKGEDALDDSTKRCMDMLCGPDGELPEKLRNLEPRLIEHISNEIMDRDPNVRWDDIAGLHHAKKCVTEMVIWPLLRPDIFKGCRSPGRGLLLFGPPGTGKTMIGKAIAGEAKATFFYISASSLTSKWIGEGEKLVRALFGVASCRQPAVIFVDEIDSLLSQRKSDGEHESSRRLKTQFLIEMEGFDSGSEQILLIGATNRPQELDEAARRRLTKRLYIPLPSAEARAWIVRNLLEKDGLFKLSTEDIDSICKLTEGYSGSDMKNLVKDASMGPLREALRQGTEITKLKKEDMRPVTLQDFENALQEVRPSVSVNELGTYEDWNNQFGSLSVSTDLIDTYIPPH
ncbi:ATPase family AAA domain-containing protein FIGL1 isoform X2 [Cynara cardunculus var. scolymus]|uniref:ATPase family AAA domain-containing protein FIGL1 isoform X2 n=1 Tax=Cynara cardunculus var. scolymus TaxID=59895 RepID=UPI000D62DA2E|nr:ATPase family AAA domain-containing protein FIGL1 isoform X2 [Cynara cardunculus var. scolymus]